MDSKVEVSIICNAYNQEMYIRDTIEGFVSQITNFKFEILIHDDASSDNTADIIREYENRYPDIVKPIYQEKNQYSMGVSITEMYQLPRVSGKYIAFCEGDDFWIDSNKLQKQYDVLESNPEIDICAHKTKCVDGKTDELISYVEPIDTDGILSIEQVILGGGGYVSTCSLFYRARLSQNPPLFRKKYYFDYSLQIYGSLKGGMMYLKDCMAVYRWHSASSWTSKYLVDTNHRKNNFELVKNMLYQFNADTNNKYIEQVDRYLLESEFHLLESEKNYKMLLGKRFNKLRLALPIKYQLYILYKGMTSKG